MAPTPHPVGSPAEARIRDYLLARMTMLGLSPRVWRGESHRAETFGSEFYVSGADVENVVGVLPGRNPALPALLLMAHRDSVPGSPGAADDVTGVACALEMVRAIRAGGTPARDVVVAITDGEEAGLLGANAFFAHDPLATRIGFVINLEARGGGGRATMFETGADNGGAIDLLARTAREPSATSLSVFVYRLLPNDTDFSIARARGLPGLNYAFIGRQFDYHSPSSTVAALDKGSVQQMGDEVLGTARALATSRTLPAPAPDKVYADVLGLLVIAYPVWIGWVVLAAAAGLIGAGAWPAAARRELRAGDIAKGAASTLLLLIGSGLALAATRHLTGVGFGFLAQRPLLARFPLFEAAMATSGLGALLIAVGVVAGGRTRLAGVWTGLLLAALVLAAALQAAAPTIGFLIAWPLLIAAAVSAATAAGGESRRAPLAVAGVAIVAITAWLAVMFHVLLQGLDVPEAPAAIVWLAALSLWPLAWPGLTGRFAPGALLLLTGLALALFIRLSPPWTARHPQAAEPILVINPIANRAWRADQVTPGAWSRAWLTSGGEQPEPLRLPGLERPVQAVGAPMVAATSPVVSVRRAADGAVVIRAQPAPGAETLRLDMMCDTLLTDARIDGQPGRLASPGHWTHLRWQAAPEGFTVSFKPVGPGRLDLRWAQYLGGWPAGASPLPAMPRKVMAWDMAGSTVVVGRRTVGL